MPFRSEKQRRYLWKNHPKIARDWTDTYGSKPVKKNSGGSIEKPPKKGWTKIFGDPVDWDNLNKDQEKWLKDHDYKRPQKKSKGGTMTLIMEATLKEGWMAKLYRIPVTENITRD